jgi:hypothetical protein
VVALVFAWRGRSGSRADLLGVASSGALLVGWALASASSVFVQARYFPYHYLPMIPPLALGLGALLLFGLRFAPLRPWLAGVALVAFVAASLRGDPYPARYALLAAVWRDPSALARHWREGRYGGSDMSLADNLAIAAWLRENTRPEDPVFVWSYDPMVYFLAERRLVSRFLYTFPLVVPWGPDAYDAELLDALRAEPPVVFVVGSKDATPHVTGNRLDSEETFERSGPIAEFVQTRYTPVARVARFTVWRRNDEVRR